jgi:adenine phosphoribosyltransferase
MSAFNRLHIVPAEASAGLEPDPLVVVGAGCTTGDIIRTTVAANLTVPLGARPSVGAGLWLQGGVGHLSRLYGLACDSIVGAIVVSVASGQILCVGCVPTDHCPAGAVRPENEDELLWALKGAGTNFGIVLSVTFKTYPASVFVTQNWIVPLIEEVDVQQKLSEFGTFAGMLDRESSVDAYLYWEGDSLHLGIAMIEVVPTGETISSSSAARALWGPPVEIKTVDGIGLFNAELYISTIHGGHAGGKSSSFKRCIFLKDIGSVLITNRLKAALQVRPSPFCYVHCLHGGGAVHDITPDATAFGCRDWDYACVITGVWPREQDGTTVARAAVQWVYDIANGLLALSHGVYGADLGPDPRDAVLAAKAFGSNASRLARLKRKFDPKNVLAYACPLPQGPRKRKLIVLVTGEHGAGKDYCADVWVDIFTREGLMAKSVSISDATKREYAAASGADLELLLRDRVYKEVHRPALTAFYEQQVQKRPMLPEEHFLSVVRGERDVDVLFITGMRDEAPVAAFSHLVSECRLIEVNVRADAETRRMRRGGHNDTCDKRDGSSTTTDLRHSPTFNFTNDRTGSSTARAFAEQHLAPFYHPHLDRLNNMVHSIPNFPSPGITFRHVLGIAQQTNGFALCTSLLQSHFFGNWANIDAIVSCEVGGLVFASALALQVNVPLVLIREAGKLPLPTMGVTKGSSWISSQEEGGKVAKTFEVEKNVLYNRPSIVVIDDVLSSGETMCAILELLTKAGMYFFSARLEYFALRSRNSAKYCRNT